jgi:hypothetical protein
MAYVARLLIAILFVGLTACGPCCAQSSYDLYGSARADALGNSTTASTSSTGVHANPAARAAADTQVAIFYARQSFGLSVLRYGASHATLPFDWGVVSTGASTFGFEEYREVHLNAGYARSFSFGTSRAAHVGLTTRYYHTSIAEYGNAGAFSINLGIVLRLLRSLRLGAHATNVNGGALVKGEPLPRTLSVGLSYQALRQMRVLVDVFKDVRFPASVRGGIEVHPVSALALRAGVTTTPVRFMGGAGIRLGRIQADVAVEQHQDLGWSPSASLKVYW